MELSRPMYPGINNSPRTSLTSEISAAAQDIPVADISVFPPAPNLATIGTSETAEVIRYNGISGNALTGCERGFDGTTASLWRADTAVFRAFTKYDYDSLRENISDLLAKIGTSARTQTSNPNLLDNWDFRNPVNQRNGYVVPTGTTYYSNTAVTTSAGSVSKYTAAEYVNTTYGRIVVDGTTYYVKYTDMVRGYIGIAYGVDRWRCQNGSTVATLESNGLKLISQVGASGNTYVTQVVEGYETSLLGKRMTFSALVSGTTADSNAAVAIMDGTADAVSPTGEELTSHFVQIGTGTKLLTITGVLPNEVSTQIRFSLFGKKDAANVIFHAAKLELGDKQTLARQDAEGNWVLIDPPPNPALELLKCQRYFFRLKSRGSSYIFLSPGLAQSTASVQIHYSLPTEMRINPTISRAETGLFVITNRDPVNIDARKTLSDIEMATSNLKDFRMRFIGNSFEVDRVYNAWLTPEAYIDFSADL